MIDAIWLMPVFLGGLAVGAVFVVAVFRKDSERALDREYGKRE